MRLNVSLNISKKIVILALIIFLGIGIGIFIGLNRANANPVPPNIKSQLSYKVIYPAKRAQIDASSYQYETNQKALSFKLNLPGQNIVFTEQPAPDALGADTQTYYPALGIHPYAQFRTSLGLVALTKFYKTGSLEPAGQSAVLVSQGTLLVANSEKKLTNAEWKDLFDSLKISR